MATWVRLGTGTAPTAFNADLVGNYALDNATAPGDFDPAAVTSVRTQWTITGSGFADDSWDNVAGCALVTGATEISQHPGEGSTNNQNVARSTDHTDSTAIPTGLSTTQWQDAVVRGDGVLDAWCLWNKVKSADGSTLTVSALTVTITYTPSSANRTGTIAATQASDTSAIAGTTVAPAFTGTVVGTQTNDTPAISGTFTPLAITGTIAVTQADDVGAFAGTTPILEPPTGLTATAFSTTRIDVSWNAVALADAYDLERDTVIIVHKTTALSYQDEGLTPDTEYTYRVRSARTI